MNDLFPTESAVIVVGLLLGIAAVLLLVLAWLGVVVWIRRRLWAGDVKGKHSSHHRFRLLGNLLIAVGVGGLLLGLSVYIADLSQGVRVLPQPVALVATREAVGPPGVVLPPEQLTTAPTSTAAPTSQAAAATQLHTATPSATAVPTATVVPTKTPVPTETPVPAKPGVPIRLTIPSIGVDSKVREAGTYWENGQLLWETVPFVVAHYRSTAKAGEKGNAVLSGHVTSKSAGNVFADLYKVQLGDEIHVYTEESEFTYVVSRVRLVSPSDVSVMDPTPDATATLITCAGEWIPAQRQYSQRLIVSAKLQGQGGGM